MFSTIDISELTAILNHLYFFNHCAFKLYSPVLEMPLVGIDLKSEKTIINIPEKGYYYSKYDNLKDWFLKNNNRYAIQEFPDWSAYKNSFIMAGITGYTNKQRIKEEITATLSRDVLKGHPSSYIAFDTNILRDRFFSTTILKDDEFKGKTLSFLLTDIVRDELTFSYKYTDRDIESYVAHPDLAKKSHIIDNFWNQNKLKDRMQRLGYIEYNKIQNFMNFHICGNPGEAGGKTDMKIIQNYQSFVSAYRQVVLISRDFDFIAIAQGRSGIQPLRAELPDDINFEESYNWDRICELIYLWSILYGCIELKIDDSKLIRFYGLWRGKEPSDWNDERIALEVEGLDLKSAVRDIEICRKLGKIN